MKRIVIVLAALALCLVGPIEAMSPPTNNFPNGLTAGFIEVENAPNYVRIDPEYGLRMFGDATVWDDLKFPAQAIRTAGAKPPTSTAYSVGYSWSFTDTAVLGNEQELFVVAQMPHGYQLGEDVIPHVHWSPSCGQSNSVRWCVDVDTAPIGEDFKGSARQTLCGNFYTQAHNQLKHLQADLPVIDGASLTNGENVSAIIHIRLYRNSSEQPDDLTCGAILHEFDIHYPVDRLGSRTEDAQ